MLQKLTLLILIIGSLAWAQKAPFTISDLYQLKSVSDPQFSPDGKMIAFTVTGYYLPENKSNTDIWLYKMEDGELTQLTHNSSADFHPRWSPDGSKLLFVSYRSKSAQAWVLPMGGGEPYKLTDFYTGVESPQWLPDGKGLLFVSHVFPEAGADSKKNEELAEQLSDGPVQAHWADGLLYRHWTEYRDWQYKHLFRFQIEDKKITELTSGKLDAPAYSLGGSEFTISPDGNFVAFSVKDVKNPASSTNNDIWVLDLSDNSTTNITEENKAFDGSPLFSPDGQSIAYLTQKVPGYESDKFRLAVYDVKNETSKILSEDIDNWVDDFAWSPDASTIYFFVEEKGYFPIYKVQPKGGVAVKLMNMTRIGGFDLSPNGAWLVGSKSSIQEPVELWKISLGINKKAEEPKRLTFFNKEVEDRVDIRDAEEHWVHTPEGENIHTFIIKPHDFDPDEKYPLVMNVHGGPQMQWSQSFRGDWQVYPGAGYVLVFPNPHGSTGYGQKFTEGISKDWGGKVHNDILAVADYVGKLSYTDENRMGAMGWSWGGYYMMWLEGHKHPFKTLVSMMGVYDLDAMWGATEELWFPEWDLGGTPYNSDLYQKWSPHRYMDKFSTPCLVLTGEKDYRVPYTQSLEFFTALQRKGVDSRLIVFKNDGHWPSYLKSMPVYYNAHLQWFHKYLGGAAAPWDTEKLIRNQVFKP